MVEAKAQLVGIHERVRSDMEGSKPPTSAVPSTTQDGTKRVASATNPNAEDAAELLRYILIVFSMNLDQSFSILSFWCRIPNITPVITEVTLKFKS